MAGETPVDVMDRVKARCLDIERQAGEDPRRAVKLTRLLQTVVEGREPGEPSLRDIMAEIGRIHGNDEFAQRPIPAGATVCNRLLLLPRTVELLKELGVGLADHSSGGSCHKSLFTEGATGEEFWVEWLRIPLLPAAFQEHVRMFEDVNYRAQRRLCEDMGGRMITLSDLLNYLLHFLVRARLMEQEPKDALEQLIGHGANGAMRINCLNSERSSHSGLRYLQAHLTLGSGGFVYLHSMSGAMRGEKPGTTLLVHPFPSS